MTPPTFDIDSATASGAASAAARVAIPAEQGRSRGAPRVVAHGYGERDRSVRRVLALSDAAAYALALTLAFVGEEQMWSHVAWGLLALPVWLVICNAYGLYGRDIRRISHGTVDDLPGLAHAVVIGSLLLWLYYHLVPGGKLHFKYILLVGSIALISATVLRACVRRWIRLRLGGERVLLIGDDDAIALLAGKFANHPEYGLDIVGLVAGDSDARSPATGGALAGVRRLGAVDQLDIAAVAAEHGIHRIVVAHGDLPTERLLELVRRAQESAVKVSVVPQPFDAMGPSVQVDNVEGLTVFGMYPPVLARSSRAMKRAMDLAGSLVILVAFAPLMLLIALAIKLDTPGPVLFRQRRVGRGGRTFNVLKFRTMVARADEMVGELLHGSSDPDWLLLEHDPRITRVGRVLRHTSLDELPQAWNVFRGEMSLVGPRPLVESEDRKIRGWGRCRIDLTPGMTGLWQVLGRTSIPFREMVTLDYLYVTNWSLWGDVKLLLSTVPVLLSRRGAN